MKSKLKIMPQEKEQQNQGKQGSSELQKKSIDELLQIAKEKNISNKWEMNKQQLIQAIESGKQQGQSQNKEQQGQQKQQFQEQQGSLRNKSLDELIQIAKEKNISNKFEMDKEELVKAIEGKGGEQKSQQVKGGEQKQEQRGPVDLRKMRIDELLKLAKEKNIANKWEMDKNELIEAIQKAK